MGKINFLLLIGFIGVTAADEIPQAIAIVSVLSVIACVVPLLCLCVVVGLIARLLQMQRKLRGTNHVRFEEHDYELSLNDCNTKSYKRISNVYEKTEMDNKDSSESDSQNDVNTQDPNYENSPSLKISEVQQHISLDIELEPVADDDGIYEVMTSPKGYYKEETSFPKN